MDGLAIILQSVTLEEVPTETLNPETKEWVSSGTFLDYVFPEKFNRVVGLVCSLDEKVEPSLVVDMLKHIVEFRGHEWKYQQKKGDSVFPFIHPLLIKKGKPNYDKISDLVEGRTSNYKRRRDYRKALIGFVKNSINFQFKQEKKQRRIDYHKYLESPEWIAKRNLVMARAGGRCEGCFSADATEVHHLTYKRIFREMMFDLVAVCRDCHAQIHEEES